MDRRQQAIESNMAHARQKTEEAEQELARYREMIRELDEQKASLLAAAQEIGASGQDLITASVAGYECGVRGGEFLGRSHYRIFHTTATAGKLGAAAGVARLLGLDARRMNHCLGSAGTMAAGLWEFLRDAADSKQLHTAKAAADGLLAAYIARDGFTGASRIFEGPKGMVFGLEHHADEAGSQKGPQVLRLPEP